MPRVTEADVDAIFAFTDGLPEELCRFSFALRWAVVEAWMEGS